MAILNAIAAAGFWLIALALIVLWVIGYREAWQSQKYALALCSAFLVPIGLFVLFWLEGMEAAYGELRDVEPEQIDDRYVRRVLDEMQRYDELFVGQREFFVVVGILIISLLTDFDLHLLHRLPFAGSLAKYFGLIFTSLLVFWFGSVASKKLAFRNPQKFLRYCSFLWPAIRKPSWTVYLAPADSVAGYLANKETFKEHKPLSPSRISYYEQSFKRYGYASHCTDVAIKISDLGCCTITETGLLWVIQGERYEFKGSVSVDARVDDPQFKFVRLLKGPRWTGERTKEIFRAMNSLFEFATEDRFPTATDGDLPAGLTGLGVSFLSQRPISKPIRKKDEDGNDLDKQVSIRIESPVALPEGLRLPTNDASGVAENQGALLLYRFECHGSSGAFKLDGRDSFGHSLTVPCGKLVVTVQFDESVKRQIAVPKYTVMLDGTENKGEWARIRPGITEHNPHKLKLEADYPLPGANIVLEWAAGPEQ